MSYNLDHKSANLDSRQGTAPTILVLHYTAVDFPTSLYLLTDPNARKVSSHYLVPEEGSPVYQLVPEEMRAWHAGVSYWRGKEALNAHSIGIEIVNLGPVTTTPTPTTDGPNLWQPFPEVQLQAVITLCKEILQRHDIPACNVVGHSDVAPTRKTDPGPVFPWKRLAENGIGVWYTPLPTDDARRLRAPGAREPSAAWCKDALRAWGYKVGDAQVGDAGELDAETRSAVAAFQLHFRPSKFDGTVDAETCDILESLLIAHDIKL
eukprot:Phypoly_transcript_14642.p1 GENE.Phypoly_transcript_14642~~Phypoly_transcript_14642.p1  ORF type:complete len:264 (+),score=46.42 Phypoly_transcript_14642:189-980(+)